MLWSFLRSHLLNKTICFLSTCKQVWRKSPRRLLPAARYLSQSVLIPTRRLRADSPRRLGQVRFVFETFKRLRPGVPLRMLHGKMKQMKRMAVFYEFCEAKVAARVQTAAQTLAHRFTAHQHPTPRILVFASVSTLLAVAASPALRRLLFTPACIRLLNVHSILPNSRVVISSHCGFPRAALELVGWPIVSASSSTPTTQSQAMPSTVSVRTPRF